MKKHKGQIVSQASNHDDFLTSEDYAVFFEAILNPVPPNAKLKQAFAKYNELIASGELIDGALS